MSADPVKDNAYESFKALVGVYNNKKVVSGGRTEIVMKSGTYEWLQDPSQKVSGLDAPMYAGLWHDIIADGATYKLFADALPKSDKFTLLQVGLQGLSAYIQIVGYGRFNSVSHKLAIKDEAGARKYIATMVDSFYTMSAASAAKAQPAAPVAPAASVPAVPLVPAIPTDEAKPAPTAPVQTYNPVSAAPVEPAKAVTFPTPAVEVPADAKPTATGWHMGMDPAAIQPSTTVTPVVPAPAAPVTAPTVPTPDPVPEAKTVVDPKKIDKAVDDLQDLF